MFKRTFIYLLSKYFPVLHRIYSKHIDLAERRKRWDTPGLEQRACHARELFVRYDGYIFPCALVWGREDMKIAHVNDEDIISKIISFHKYCSCERYKMVKADQCSYDFLGLEMSLECQASCAMCCVGSPDWHGEYELYNQIETLISVVKPKEIKLEGGEIMVQKRTIEWLRKIKKKFPDIKYSLATNGSFSLEKISIVEELFQKVAVSFVGFQKETYRTIMGLDIQRTRAFVEYLAAARNIEIVPKYLVTPLNVHEIPLFIEWSIRLKPWRIRIDDSHAVNYVEKNTDDKYWQKIFERTRRRTMNVITEHAQFIRDNNVVIGFDSGTISMLGLNMGEFADINMKDNVVWNKLAGGIIQ